MGQKRLKVLYISHHREPSGWGQAARDYILALDKAGVDVVCRAVKVSSTNADLPDSITRLENKSSQGANICIQHLLPYHMVYHSHFDKCIGLYVQETWNIEYTSWPGILNTMDEIWVPNQQMKSDITRYIKPPVNVVPHTFDIEKYNRRYSPLPNISKDSFTFYYIGEINRRKHLASLLRAFLSEFSSNEPVKLLLKANKPGLSPDQTAKEIDDLCGIVKQNIKLNRCPEIDVITNYLSEEDIYRLHTSCDCFVQPSFGEAWSIPCWEAMAFGKTPISTKTGGMSDYIINKRTGFLIDGQEECVIGYNETFSEFGKPQETWTNIDTLALQKKMREVYEMSDEQREQMITVSKKHIENYSYENIGNKMKELLNE